MNTDNTSSLLQKGDPKEEIKALKEALREKSMEIDKLRKQVDEKPVFGEWQLCPKCNGYGQLFNSVLYPGTAIGWYSCDICCGAKIIMRPIIPSNK